MALKRICRALRLVFGARAARFPYRLTVECMTAITPGDNCTPSLVCIASSMAAFPHLIRQTIDTPTGELCLVADSAGSLYAVDWLDRQERMSKLLGRYHRGHAPVVDGDVVPSLVTAFQRYFDGALHAIDALPCARAGTAFQQRVWTALRAIPCGETMSYGDLAHRLGSVAVALLTRTVRPAWARKACLFFDMAGRCVSCVKSRIARAEGPLARACAGPVDAVTAGVRFTGDRVNSSSSSSSAPLAALSFARASASALIRANRSARSFLAFSTSVAWRSSSGRLCSSSSPSDIASI